MHCQEALTDGCLETKDYSLYTWAQKLKIVEAIDKIFYLLN